MNTQTTLWARDLVLLIARIGLGVLMFAHAQVMYEFGGSSIEGASANFEAGGVPLPSVSGPLVLFGEWIGGIAIIIGAAVPLVGALMVVNMIGAWIFVHPTGLYNIEGTGPETVIAIGLLCLVLVVTGGGRISVDHQLLRRLRPRFAAASGERAEAEPAGRGSN